MENFEAFDAELKGVLGHRYQEQPVRKSKPVEKEPDWYARLKLCVKRSWVFSALSLLVFYWQQTGLMDPAAAVPSLYACALMFGLTIGKCGTERR